MFKPILKKKQRERLLSTLTDKHWLNLPDFLKPNNADLADPANRKIHVNGWITRAEKEDGRRTGFARGLDRFLKEVYQMLPWYKKWLYFPIRTDSEDKEYRDYYAMKRNRVASRAFLVSIIALCVSGISVWISCT